MLSTGGRVAGSSPAVLIIANGELVAEADRPHPGPAMGDGAAGWARQPHRVGGGRQMAVLAVALRALRRTNMASRARDSTAAAPSAASSPTGVSFPLGDAGAATGTGCVDR